MGVKSKKGGTRQKAETAAKKLMVTGVRKGGESDFHFEIHGNPASQFPPLILKMTLHEMQQWLHEQQSAPPNTTKHRRATLRLVS